MGCQASRDMRGHEVVMLCLLCLLSMSPSALAGVAWAGGGSAGSAGGRCCDDWSRGQVDLAAHWHQARKQVVGQGGEGGEDPGAGAAQHD